MLNRKMQRGGVMKKLRARVSFPRRDGLCVSRGFRTRALTLRFPHRCVRVFSILLFLLAVEGFREEVQGQVRGTARRVQPSLLLRALKARAREDANEIPSALGGRARGAASPRSAIGASAERDGRDRRVANPPSGEPEEAAQALVQEDYQRAHAHRARPHAQRGT